MKQPDLHYDGEITQDFVTDLGDQLYFAMIYLNSLHDFEEDWICCKKNWLESLRYAGLRCAAITCKLQYNFEITQDDKKCIDITLCLLRDFEDAKSKNFTLQSN